MKDEILYDKIEAYLQGALSPDETKAFEADMAANPQLAYEVDMHRLEWDAMEVILENDLRANMATWQKEEKIEKVAIIPPLKAKKGGLFNTRFYVYAAAASVALLAVCVWYFNKEPKIQDNPIVVQPPIPKVDSPGVPPQYEKPKTDNSELVKSNQKPTNQNKRQVKPETPVNNPLPKMQEPNNQYAEYTALANETYKSVETPDFDGLSRGIVNNNTNYYTLDEVKKAYKDKDFNKVITLLKNTERDTVNFNLLEILAHTYYQNKQPPNAIPIFKQLVEWSGKKSLNKMEWYLLLSYLSDYKNHATDFETLSKKIMENPDHEYLKETENLVKKIPK